MAFPTPEYVRVASAGQEPSTSTAADPASVVSRRAAILGSVRKYRRVDDGDAIGEGGQVGISQQLQFSLLLIPDHPECRLHEVGVVDRLTVVPHLMIWWGSVRADA